MDKAIKGFKDEYSWLSNFWPADVEYEGKKFPSVEHAYVYAKMLFKNDIEYRKIVEMTAREVKAYGREVELIADWDKQKVVIMTMLVHSKFDNSPELAEKLLATGNCYIEETNYWKDRFWGVCDGEGENRLGFILMCTRNGIQLAKLF